METLKRKSTPQLVASDFRVQYSLLVVCGEPTDSYSLHSAALHPPHLQPPRSYRKISPESLANRNAVNAAICVSVDVGSVRVQQHRGTIWVLRAC
jgi:hypothetical protein